MYGTVLQVCGREKRRTWTQPPHPVRCWKWGRAWASERLASSLHIPLRTWWRLWTAYGSCRTLSPLDHPKATLHLPLGKVYDLYECALTKNVGTYDRVLWKHICISFVGRGNLLFTHSCMYLYDQSESFVWTCHDIVGYVIWSKLAYNEREKERERERERESFNQFCSSILLTSWLSCITKTVI